MNERVDAWMKLATERLTDGNAPLYLIPGNDDEFVIDPILDQPGIKPINADDKVLDIPGDLQLLAPAGRTTHRGRRRGRSPRTSSTPASTRSLSRSAIPAKPCS